MKTKNFFKNVMVMVVAGFGLMVCTSAQAQEGNLTIDNVTNICNTVHCQDLVVRRGATLEVAPDASLVVHGQLIVEDGAKVTNMGCLMVDSAVTNRGTVYNYGSLSGSDLTNYSTFFNCGNTSMKTALRNYWVVENFGKLALSEYVDRF